MTSYKRIRELLLQRSAHKSTESPLSPPSMTSTSEDYKWFENDKYEVFLPLIGRGGFSHVLAVKPIEKPTKKRWRPQSLSAAALRGLMRKKSSTVGIEPIESYPFAAKVCELNGEKLQPSKDEILMDMGEYNQRMQAADLVDLQREVEILREVQDSTLVVKLHDAFEYKPNEQYWMIMERVTTSLTHLTLNGLWQEFPDARVCVLREVLEALIYLKSKRIVHQDIKPHNVLVGDTGVVKLCDFGIAQKIPEEGGMLIVGEQRGSLPYMAPELFIEGCEYDYAVDVWSFGWVIWSTYTKNSTVKFEHRSKSPYGQRFKDYDWEHWSISDARYFEHLLAPRYVTQEERNSIRAELDAKLGRPRIDYVVKMRQDVDAEANVWYPENIDRVTMMRSIMIPHPVKGPKGDIQRSTFVPRATVEDICLMPYFANQKHTDTAERQNEIRKVFKSSA